jgi:DNA-binding GntR family transcriptional regulator
MDRIHAQLPLPRLVYNAIVDAICEGTLRPGERLTQDDIAERMDVSRLPVGQALHWLEADGFVCPAGRRGLKVAPLEPALVRELYEFRCGIDMIAAGMAALRGTNEQRERGRRILEDGHSARRAGDVAMLIGADIDFHQLVYEMAGNSVLMDAMAPRWNHIRRVMIAIIDDTDSQTLIWEEHTAIFTAILAGDAVRAERLARAHVERAAGTLVEGLVRSTRNQRSVG